MLPAKAGPLGLGLLGGVGLAKLPRRSVAFFCQSPDDSSPSKLGLDLVRQSTKHEPGVNIVAWRAQLLESCEDLGILLLRGDSLPELPSSLSLLVLNRSISQRSQTLHPKPLTLNTSCTTS